MSYHPPSSDRVHVGTFIKSPGPHAIEILAGSGLDFAVLDAEHAPWDAAALDIAMLAGRATGLPLFVRVPDRRSMSIGQALDMGAFGVLVPHVDTAKDARDVLAAARYTGGTRGFSGSPRHGGYGTMPRAKLLTEADSTAVICQIESTEAVRNVEAIAEVEGIGGLFIGRADLALSMGIHDPRDSAVDEATQRIIRAGISQNLLVGMFVSDNEERHRYAGLGVRWFVQGSDQALLRRAALDMVRV